MILNQLGIFGWKEADENLVLASLLTGDPLLLTSAPKGLPTCVARQGPATLQSSNHGHVTDPSDVTSVSHCLNSCGGRSSSLSARPGSPASESILCSAQNAVRA